MQGRYLLFWAALALCFAHISSARPSQRPWKESRKIKLFESYIAGRMKGDKRVYLRAADELATMNKEATNNLAQKDLVSLQSEFLAAVKKEYGENFLDGESLGPVPRRRSILISLKNAGLDDSILTNLASQGDIDSKYVLDQIDAIAGYVKASDAGELTSKELKSLSDKERTKLQYERSMRQRSKEDLIKAFERSTDRDLVGEKLFAKFEQMLSDYEKIAAKYRGMSAPARLQTSLGTEFGDASLNTFVLAYYPYTIDRRGDKKLVEIIAETEDPLLFERAATSMVNAILIGKSAWDSYVVIRKRLTSEKFRECAQVLDRISSLGRIARYDHHYHRTLSIPISAALQSVKWESIEEDTLKALCDLLRDEYLAADDISAWVDVVLNHNEFFSTEEGKKVGFRLAEAVASNRDARFDREFAVVAKEKNDKGISIDDSEVLSRAVRLIGKRYGQGEDASISSILELLLKRNESK